MACVLIAYVDESYDHDTYFIGAAVADEATWELVAEGFEAVRQRTTPRHSVPANAEFHGHELMGGRGDWRALRGQHREAAGIYAAALQASLDAGVRYLFRGVDVRRLNARYAYPRSPHSVVLSHLLERLNDYSKTHGGGQQTIVVADQIATQEQHQAQFEDYQRIGTDGYRSSTLANISSPINFADSRLSPGLQAVDMATYIHRRASTVINQHPRAQATTDRLTKLIYPATVHRWVWRP